MRKIIALQFILVFLTICCFGNQIPYIINVSRKTENGKLILEFDVFDKENSQVRIYLLDRKTGTMLKEGYPGVTGDLGRKIKTGKKKKIVCDIKKTNIIGFNPIIFVSDGEAVGTEMIKLRECEESITYISRFETMNVQFLMFLETGGYSNQEYWRVIDTKIVDEYLAWDYCTRYRWTIPRFWDFKDKPNWKNDPYSSLPTTPIIGISWFEANGFCLWSETQLMSKEDWLLMVLDYQGEKDPEPPWGLKLFEGQTKPKFTKGNLKFNYHNYEFNGFKFDGYRYCAPVGMTDPIIYNKQEIYDLVGNAYEWVQDFNQPVVYATHTCVDRFLLGGSWKTGIRTMTLPMNVLCPIYRKETIGFRYKIVVEK